jgi:hypothetical protein
VNGPTTIQNGGGTVLIGAALDDGAAACPGNTLHGPLTISSNLAGIEVESDWITGPVTLTNNEGPAFLGSKAGAEVEANHISGPLTCHATRRRRSTTATEPVTGPEAASARGSELDSRDGPVAVVSRHVPHHRKPRPPPPDAQARAVDPRWSLAGGGVEPTRRVRCPRSRPPSRKAEPRIT